MGNVIVSSITRTPVDQGGGVWGGLGAGVTPPTNFEAQKLYTSQDMTLETGFNGLTTADWITNEEEPFARITWPTSGSTSGLLYSFANRNSDRFYVSYYIRRHQVETSKQFKMLGQDFGGINNTTLGATSGGYSGTRMDVYWGDAVSGGNDNSVQLRYDGTLTGGSSYSRTAPTFVYAPTADVFQDITGTVWQRVEYYFKYNSDNTADGEVGIAIDGARVFQASGVYNCANGAQAINRLGLGEYSNSQSVPVVEDYKKLDIGYDRPSWMT